MRALTLWRPWAWSLFHGKPVENRPWEPPAWLRGQTFAIHAGKRFDAEGEAFLRRALDRPLLPSEAAAEGIVGVVTLDRIVREWDFDDPMTQSPFFFGTVGWVLRDVRELARPIPCRGFQGLWPLPDDIERAVREQIARAG